jgi:hypothetical protein
MSLGCVDCTPGGHWRPTTFYIYQGDSLCISCLGRRKDKDLPVVVPENDEEPDDYEELDDGPIFSNLTMKLYDRHGVCLMYAPVNSPVVNGDTIQFPPIKITISD